MCRRVPCHMCVSHHHPRHACTRVWTDRLCTSVHACLCLCLSLRICHTGMRHSKLRCTALIASKKRDRSVMQSNGGLSGVSVCCRCTA